MIFHIPKGRLSSFVHGSSPCAGNTGLIAQCPDFGSSVACIWSCRGQGQATQNVPFWYIGYFTYFIFIFYLCIYLFERKREREQV